MVQAGSRLSISRLSASSKEQCIWKALYEFMRNPGRSQPQAQPTVLQNAQPMCMAVQQGSPPTFAIEAKRAQRALQRLDVGHQKKGSSGLKGKTGSAHIAILWVRMVRH